MNSGIRKTSYSLLSGKTAKCVKESAKGFTLIEALAVLLIAGILIAFGVPRFEIVIKNNRLATTTNEIMGALNFARTEAIRRGATVHIGPYPANDNVGWIVWIDGGDNGPGDANDTEIRVWPAVPDDVTVTVNPSATFFAFNNSGAVDKAATFTVCDNRAGESGSVISLLISGSLNRVDNACL